MQRMYLHNSKVFKKTKEEVRLRETKKLTIPQNVDINKLLNRIKINEINKKRENLLFLGIGTFIVGAVSILIFL